MLLPKVAMIVLMILTIWWVLKNVMSLFSKMELGTKVNGKMI